MLRKALSNEGWLAIVEKDPHNNRVYLEVIKGEAIDFVYEIRLVTYDTPDYGLDGTHHSSEQPAPQYGRAEVFLRRGGQSYDIYGYDKQSIIRDLLDQFEKYLHFLHVSPSSLPWKMAEHDDLLSESEQASHDPSDTTEKPE